MCGIHTAVAAAPPQNTTPPAAAACVRVWRPDSLSHSRLSPRPLPSSLPSQAAPRAGPSSRGALLVEARVAVRRILLGVTGEREGRELAEPPPALTAGRPTPTSSHPSPPSHAHAHTDPLPALWPQEGALLPPGRHRLPGPPGGPAAGGERERGEMRGAGGESGGHFPPPKTSAPFPSFHPSHRSSLSSLYPPFSSHSAWATTTPCARRPT